MRKLKPSEKQGPLVPVLILERYETSTRAIMYRSPLEARSSCFSMAFSSISTVGQVVPAGLGGDILFSTNAPEGPRIIAVGQNRHTTLEKPLQPLAANAGRPSSGESSRRTIMGRYHLIANGQWSGILDLSVDADAAVTGRFRSDLNGAVHSVSGKVSVDRSSKIEFEIQFPQARQSYEGMLWTEGKNAYRRRAVDARTPLQFHCDPPRDRPDGGWNRARPFRTIARSHATDESSAWIHDRSHHARRQAVLLPSSRGLTALVKTETATGVLLVSRTRVSLIRVRHVVESIQTTGVKSIRLAPIGDQSDPK